MAEISPLRRRMIEDMTVRNLSPATQQSYLNAVSKFSRYFGRSPDRLGLEDVHVFQVHLVATGISWPALNQIVCALRFFYGVTLGQATVPERIAYAREPSKLPVVLSADEVVRFLEAIPSLKCRTALTTVYAAGLRVSEVVLVKIADIDSQRMVVRVEQGKGGKDRYVMLSTRLLELLRDYWRAARPPVEGALFPGVAPGGGTQDHAVGCDIGHIAEDILGDAIVSPRDDGGAACRLGQREAPARGQPKDQVLAASRCGCEFDDVVHERCVHADGVGCSLKFEDLRRVDDRLE